MTRPAPPSGTSQSFCISKFTVHLSINVSEFYYNLGRPNKKTSLKRKKYKLICKRVEIKVMTQESERQLTVVNNMWGMFVNKWIVMVEMILSIFIAVFLRRHAGCFFEYPVEIVDIEIAGYYRYFFDLAFSFFQQKFGPANLL